MRRRVRTFVAVEMPAEVRQSRLPTDRPACAARRRPTSDGSTPDQMHWTLKFLGDVDLLEIPEICRRLSQAVAPLAPFDVEARGAGAFPDVTRPRTVWIGMRDGTEPMIALHATVEDVLADLGFRQEQRRFRPHITLGRVRNGAAGGQEELAERLKENADFTPASPRCSRWPSFPASWAPRADLRTAGARGTGEPWPTRPLAPGSPDLSPLLRPVCAESLAPGSR